MPLGYGTDWGMTKEQQDDFAKGTVKSSELGLRIAEKLGTMVALVLNPEVDVPLAITSLTGVPVTPSPQAFASVAAGEGSAAVVDEIGNPIVQGSEETTTLYRGINEKSSRIQKCS